MIYTCVLTFMREFRIIAVALTAFSLWWGWDAYNFVNTHYSDMTDFVVAFYISIVGLAGWCIKNWMTTSAHQPTK